VTLILKTQHQIWVPQTSASPSEFFVLQIVEKYIKFDNLCRKLLNLATCDHNFENPTSNLAAPSHSEFFVLQMWLHLNIYAKSF
jgi:hypothetical protein